VRKRLVTIAKLAVSAGLLILLFRLFDFDESLRALQGIRLGYFVMAFCLFQATMVIRAFRWRALLDALGVRVPIRRLVYLYYVGVFFNTFLPSGFGGDAVKAYELARYSDRGAESLSTVLVDRLAGILVLLVMGLLAWPFVHGLLPARESLILVVVSLVGLLAIWGLFWRRLAGRIIALMPGTVGDKLASLYAAIHASGTRALGKAAAISVLFNVVLIAMNYVLALALDVRVSFTLFVAFMPILSLSMLIPSIGALGTREGAYVLLFGPAGVSEPLAIAMSLAFYAVNVLTGAIGGILYGAATLGELRDGEPNSKGVVHDLPEPYARPDGMLSPDD
jgi:uncharacterized protein (TIRG00374 family)